MENKARPDFLFPGARQYFDEAFPIAWLTILGAKTSCKDRWRQVLAEGKRLRDKYLVTLEPAISGNQLAEMRDAALQLVVPRALHSTYPAIERNWLYDVGTFIDLVHARQKESGARPQAPEDQSPKTAQESLMADVFSPEKRSAVMSQIRASGNRDTELRLINFFVSGAN